VVLVVEGGWLAIARGALSSNSQGPFIASNTEVVLSQALFSTRFALLYCPSLLVVVSGRPCVLNGGGGGGAGQGITWVWLWLGYSEHMVP
jgi:hypothetical protein